MKKKGLLIGLIYTAGVAVACSLITAMSLGLGDKDEDEKIGTRRRIIQTKARKIRLQAGKNKFVTII